VATVYVPQPLNNKEEMMKRLISLILFLVVVFIVIGCFATMTPEQRKETYDLRSSVGSSPFVGDTSSGARDLAYYQMML
jgi:hypothetical protein